MTDLPATPQDPMEKIRDKIRAEFADLMPEAAWTAMVKKAIDSFFHAPNDDRGDWHRRNGPRPKSAVDLLIHGMLKTELEEQMRKFFRSDEWQMKWNPESEEYEGGTMLREVIEAKLPQMMPYLFMHMMSAALNGGMHLMNVDVSQMTVQNENKY